MFQGPAPLPAVEPAPAPVVAEPVTPKSSLPEPLAIKPDALALFQPADLTKYEIVANGLRGLKTTLAQTKVTTAEEAATVQRVLAEAKRGFKTANETRLAQTKPHRDRESAINSQWAVLTRELEGVASVCGKVLLKWQSDERKRLFKAQEAARLAAAEAAERAKLARTRGEGQEEAEQAADCTALALNEATEAVEEMPRGIKTDSGTTSSVWRKTYKVVEEARVPHQYWSLDDRKIRQAIAAGVEAIDGLHIFEEETLRTVLR